MCVYINCASVCVDSPAMSPNRLTGNGNVASKEGRGGSPAQKDDCGIMIMKGKLGIRDRRTRMRSFTLLCSILEQPNISTYEKL